MPWVQHKPGGISYSCTNLIEKQSNRIIQIRFKTFKHMAKFSPQDPFKPLISMEYTEA